MATHRYIVRFFPTAIIRLLFFVFFFVLLSLSAEAQTTVVMPRQAVDTLWVTSTGCYTIVDPGDDGKYLNNEDSYLYIIADEPFYLLTDFELGHNDDGKDWVHVYYDTVDWYGYDYLGGVGQRLTYIWSNRALVHFHSNAYNTFDGFSMQLLHESSIHNIIFTPLTTSSVEISWDDYRSDASSWTIEYTDRDDTLFTATTNVSAITLGGLQNNRYYRYRIRNNVVACIHTDWQWLHAVGDANVTLMHPTNWGIDTIPPTGCNIVCGPSGDAIRQDFPYTSHEFRANGGHGIYLKGRYRTLSGEVGLQRRQVWNNGWWGDYNYYWDRAYERTYYQWFPRGEFGITHSSRSFFRFQVINENDSYLLPTVTAVSNTSATISWTDETSSTSWVFSYCKEEGRWVRANTTSPTITLNGLEEGCQYVYTIEGNVKRDSCDVPARHAFVTEGSGDTVIMPYRGSQTVVIEPRRCYTIVDAGGGCGNYFNTDFSRLVVRTANGKGFRIVGRTSLQDNDQLYIYNGDRYYGYSGSTYDIRLSSVDDSVVFYFQSDIKGLGRGFSFDIIQVDDSIYNLHTTAVGTTAASIAWDDNSGATSWTVHYGLSEESFQTISVNTKSATIGGLLPATQYVYFVTNDNSSSASCLFSERKGFITEGLPQGDVIMPYRSTDTLVIQPGTCYRIWDAGGREHNYFNDDTSVLVIISADNSDFYLDGQWLFGGNEAEYHTNSYDSYDRFAAGNNPNNTSYNWEYDGWRNRYAYNDRIRIPSSNGYLRIRFTSNGNKTSPGFCFTIDHSGGTVTDLKMTRVTRNSATVTWNDNSNAAQWIVAYKPASGTSFSTAYSSLRSFTLNNLAPNTDYELKVYRANASQCDAQSTFFTTLDNNSIVMTPGGNDTVYLTPGQCYYVYDPGGTGDYLPSDTSRLTLISSNGEGFYLSGEAIVGSSDRSDYIYMTGVANGQYYWSWEQWRPDGIFNIELRTNEAIQDRGLWIWIRFPSRVYDPDTINHSDSTVTITWQDTTSATQWNFSYGTHIDSMTTVTTSTKQYTLTGLERNRQYFYSIYNTDENPDCVLENFYGYISPCDPDILIQPYQNYYLAYAGRYSQYYSSHIDIDLDYCYHFRDIGSVSDIFQNSYSGCHSHFHDGEGVGVTLEGYYDLGSSSVYIGNNTTGSWYSNSGYLTLYAPNGYVSFDQRSGTSCSDFAPGFDFKISFNYPIYNVRTQNVSCNSATLLFDDSTAATQWYLAYGPTEKQLDTIVLNTKSVTLDSLLPDHQYVCYISSNLNTIDCFKPVKYCFITTCDTTIFVFPYNTDTTRILDINTCYTLRDGGSSMDYIYNDRHNIYLNSSNGNAMTLRGFADMGENDYIYMWDNANGQWLGSWGKQDDIVVTVPSGQLHIEYNSAGDTVTGKGFEFRVTFHTISNIKVDLKTDTTCRLTWNDNSGATQWTCFYGRDKNNMDSIVCDQQMAHLSGLVYGKRYYVFFKNNSVACIDTTWFDFCAGGDKCVGFGDIYSCFANAYYGRVSNPNEYRGLVDYGPDDINSRHTIIDDTTATDPRTGNQLRMVCPGFPESVRLGNWDIGGEAESITYEYEVDTTKSEILLLRYAAVLENPNHSPSMQPRFRFSVVDQYNREIDPECYSADFISSDSLGWNLYRYDTNTVLWKDWTAIGIDLAPLHGQHIYFKLTTYDCAEMGHYGYAYFTLECTEKEVYPNECGVVHANTFTAPEGFRYQWFNIDSSDVTLSTERTFSSDQNGIYKCRAHFLGSTGNNCFFEKTAVVGDIFPYANYSYEIIDTNECDVVVQFRNHSCVSLDSAHTQLSSMECDGFVWDFGDGTVSYDKHPIHQFPSREFNVTLTALLANGSCSDDTSRTILMLSPCIEYDSVFPEICEGDTFALRDSVYISTGFYTVRTEYRPDSIVTTFVFLTVHPTLDTSLVGGICDGRSYTLFGFNDSIAGNYVHAFTSIYGCDSIYRLDLRVASSYDTLVDRYGCSSTGFHYLDTVSWSSTVYTDSLLSIYDCDSVVTMNITINPSFHNEHFDTICDGESFLFAGNIYTTSGTYIDSTSTVDGCDSVEVQHLKVNPVYSDSSNVLICLNETYTYRGQQYLTGLIVDSLLSYERCDSVVKINVQYFDTTFRADGILSIDTINWTRSDSSLYGCVPLTLYVRDSSVSFSSLLWLFGDGSSSSDPNAIHTYDDTGTFTVLHIATSPDGCVDTAAFINAIQVFPLPTADFEWSPQLPSNADPLTTFNNLTEPLQSTNTYLWYFYPQGADGTPADSSVEVNPLYSWPDDDFQVGNHDVTLIASQWFTTLRQNTHFCSDTVTKAIDVVNIYLQFPNVVTPNGDGYNDIWQVVNLVEFNLYPVNRLRIYNRWGRLVYQRDNISSHDDDWDPNDCDCPDGTYFFRFDAQGDFGFIQHKGAIEVIRKQ